VSRKRVHNADELMADIVAMRLVEHRERPSFPFLDISSSRIRAREQ
jgi:hypothetical protein